MKRPAFCILLFPLLILCSCRGQHSIEGSIPQFAQSRLDLLVKNPEISEHIAWDGEAIRIFGSAEHRKEGLPECVIYRDEFESFGKLFSYLPADSIQALYLSKGAQRWSDSIFSQWIPTLKRDTLEADSNQPLRGWKIALDPGHIAGNMKTAELEAKYIRMEKVLGEKEIAFWEANLTLATALIAADSLRALGAEVMVTREQPDVGIRGLTFQEWKKTSFEFSLDRGVQEGWIKPEKEEYYRKKPEDQYLLRGVFVQEDLRERARKINSFGPDLTLIIHYNVHAPNWEDKDKKGSITPTDVNYLMAFAPGSFMKGELDRPIDRIEFIRLLLTPDLENSVDLCSNFVSRSVELTQVPIVDTASDLSYLSRASVYAGTPGVYARNLSLTRLVHSPVCYGESLCQDNAKECIMLMQKDFEIGGISAPERVRTVASVYVRAVMDYSRGRKPLR